MKKLSLTALVILTFISGCSSENTSDHIASKSSIPTSVPAAPGSDRDAQGCIGSAGYAWCKHTNQCERPWELAKKEGFGNTQQGFNTYCAK